jgi:hypothetical protein
VNSNSRVGERDPSPGVGGREIVPPAAGVALRIVKVARGTLGDGVGVGVGVVEYPHPRRRASATAVRAFIVVGS